MMMHGKASRLINDASPRLHPLTRSPQREQEGFVHRHQLLWDQGRALWLLQRREEREGGAKRLCVVGGWGNVPDSRHPSSFSPPSFRQSFIVENYGFQPANIRTLTDEAGSGNELPTRVRGAEMLGAGFGKGVAAESRAWSRWTRPPLAHALRTTHVHPQANIIAGLRWLAEGAKDGDSIFLHYSGHGGTERDQGAYESNAMQCTEGRPRPIVPTPTALPQPQMATRWTTSTRQSSPWTLRRAARSSTTCVWRVG